ncbi:VNG_1110C family protein [Halorubrum sp. SY-15]|jgi:hypothetical protein|uniref:VNG_1110C family protein n=1 Tax=Halorubrum sp. SY-15 TaxID=3402277 RepID=UPI003EC067D0
MPDAATFRDSTQIRVPAHALNGLRDALEARCTVTIVEDGSHRRIVGSPTAIKTASAFLTRHGVSIA